MPAKSKRFLKVFVSALGAILALLVLGGLWLYTGQLTGAKTAVFRLIPYPLATVNGDPVLMKDFLFRYEVSKKMSGIDAIAPNDAMVKHLIYTQLIEEQKLKQLAARHSVGVSQKEIDAEYNLRAAQSDLQGKSTFEQLLFSYGLTPADYKNQVVEPELLKINLGIWFNAQPTLNLEAYKQAQDLIARLGQGQNITALSAVYSQDSTERATGGDLGFVDPAGLLPELRDAVSGMRVGADKVIASRFGLHLIRVEEQNGNKLHLREVFLKTGDFSQWYQTETKNFIIRQFVKI